MPSECPTCGEKIQTKWKYCPECGICLVGGLDSFSPDRMRYLLSQDREGRFIHENFTAIQHAGIMQWKEVEPIRSRLGDFAHLSLLNFRVFSLLLQQPKSIHDIYNIGKFIGRCSIAEAINTLGTGKLINSMIRTGLFWRIFSVKEIQKNFVDGWVNFKAGFLNVSSVDKNNKGVVFTLSEGMFSISRSNKKLDFLASGIVAGHADGLFSGNWEAYEKSCECAGDQECVIEIKLHQEDERDFTLPALEKKDIEPIIEGLVETVVGRNQTHRKKLGDYIHTGIDQTVNYYLVSPTPGHAILSKHSGVVVGEKISNKAGLRGEDAAFEYAKNLFGYLKAGILHEPETRGDGAILLKMDESVYASGVNNIHMKLDVFLAGIIEGLLKKATGEKWSVEEVKCLANGDDYCEFKCKKS